MIASFGLGVSFELEEWFSVLVQYGSYQQCLKFMI